MALQDILAAPLDLDHADAPAFLAGVQGNILKGHDRSHAAQIFLAFSDDVAAARAWISGAMALRLTTAARQAEQTAAWKAKGGAGEPFFAFALSWSGYVRLGVADDATPSDPYFRAGMKATPAGEANSVMELAPSDWEANFRGRIDAMVTIGDDNRGRLQTCVEALRKELQPFCERVFVERGDQQTFNFGPGREKVDIEHFGHQDGISQPRMIKQEAEEEVAQRGGAHWDPSAPLSLGFVAEPGAAERFGSYLVFRKLAQNVRAFRAARDGLAAALGVSADDAAALAVGRYRDGRPVPTATAPQPGADANDFDFTADPDARICPYQAHIRKTNPRGDTLALGVTEERERALRILRRGITYGERPDLVEGSTEPAPETGVGLLFISHQSQLLQFVLQQEGADSDGFVKPGVGVDATLGKSASGLAQAWPRNDAPATATFLMANFVTMKGGEYFFAPSPAFLSSLHKA